MARILVVDDSRTVRALFARVLSDGHEVRTAETGEAALELLAAWPAELAVVDINLPGIDGFETLARIRTHHPATRSALITDYDVDRYIAAALEKDVSNIIAKSSPFDAADLKRTVENLLHGERLFGLHNYLGPEASISRARVLGTDEVAALRDTCQARLRSIAGKSDVSGLCLVFEETLSNAIYHAHGYEKLTQVTLRSDQVVEVAFGGDAKRIGVAVTDRSGRLTKETVLKKILRASGEDGVFDAEGRGLFVSRVMSDRLVINIEPGKRTEIIALKFFDREHVNRPLFINQL